MCDLEGRLFLNIKFELDILEYPLLGISANIVDILSSLNEIV